MRLLAIRFSSLGDVVLATAALNYIKAEMPDAEITFLTKPAYAPLLEGHPAIGAVWPLEGSAWSMARRVRAAKFDGVLDLHGKARSLLIGAMSGATVSRMNNHAWNRRLRVWLRSQGSFMPPDVSARGVLAASRLIHRESKAAAATLEPGAEALAWADDFLKNAGAVYGENLVAICPGAAWATKRWNAGAFAQAMGLLSQQGRRFVFVGDSIDEALAHRVISYSRRGADRTIIAAGKTDFPKLAALLKRCSVLLSNDSGPMHVAGAVGTPVVALFGPTVEAFGFFPRGARDVVMQRELSCRPCSVHGGDSCPIGTHECMEKLAPFDVAKAIEGILNS